MPRKPKTVTTGERIRNARMAAGLSIAELAAAVYCPVATMELVEKDTMLPTLDLLTTAAEACQVPVEELCNVHDPADPVVRFDREFTARIDTAPPLTEDQRAILRPLLRPVPGRDGAG